MTIRPPPERPRVLVVDDSAFARKVIREVLGDDARIEVVGFARDGLDALEKIAELKPDVITLDLVMPNLDGLGVLDALSKWVTPATPPRVVIVTMSDADSPLAIAALQAGAFDLVHKPTALATDRLYELRNELVSKVLAAASGASSSAIMAPKHLNKPDDLTAARSEGKDSDIKTRVVVIGTSTGGPRALTLLLSSLPRSFPVPIIAVVHMPTGFTHGLSTRLDSDCNLDIAEASDGRVIGPGSVAIARAGIHIRVRERNGACITVLGGEPLTSLHRPSVDVLFASAAETFGANVLGVVLTGMGTDGLRGCTAIRAAGGRVIVEDPSTCVIYGMPRVVREAGLADAVARLDEMGRAIMTQL